MKALSSVSDNKGIWDAVKQPPQSALKTILAGRLKGKSDINPQWRYEAMTDIFGPCGVGWAYRVNKVWQEPASDNQIFAFANVSVKYKVGVDGDGDPVWSEPIEGWGGSMLISQETNKATNQKYLYSNDEGYKMAITDALGTAMKMLGVAADIYAGKWDGSKYAKEVDSARITPTPRSEPLPRVDGMGNDLPDVPDFLPTGGNLTVDHPLYKEIWDRIKGTENLDSEDFIQFLIGYKSGVDGAGKPRRPLLTLPEFTTMTILDAEYLTINWNRCYQMYLKSKIEKKAA